MCMKQERPTSMLHVVEQDFTFTNREKAEAQLLVLQALEEHDDDQEDAGRLGI